MSINTALNNAASGLAASARAVQVASSNVANALTPGYATRQMNISAVTLGGTGGGVRVDGVTRLVDAGLLGLHRESGASASAGGQARTFWQRIEGVIGLPGEGLSAALSALGSALISAGERPDLDSRLGAVVSAAAGVARTLSQVEDTVQQLRHDADRGIALDVRTLNEGLARIGTLNDQIVRMRVGGHSTLGLEDERQALISELSAIVPLREYPRDNGRVMLYTASGELLLDTVPAEFGFAATPVIDATMSTGNGLSGLTLNGKAVSTADTGPLGGGRLTANFRLRDIDAPEVQGELDAFAQDLIARFSDPATDPSLAGAPGLFTDAGGAATGVPGLAGRLSLNAAVDPAAGGALWRLRDGIGATAPGPVGNASQINNLLGALERTQTSGPGTARQDAAGMLGALLTSISRARQGAEDTATSAQARHDIFTEAMLSQGVDTDAEMQRLLLIQQAYAANARVIQTADAMLRTLMEI